MNEQGYDPMPEQAKDRDYLPIEEIEKKIDQIIGIMEGRRGAEEADDEEIDKDIERMMKIASQLPEGFSLPEIMMKAVHPLIPEMTPEARRRFCADMATCGSPSNNNNKTGRYFNGFKSARGLAEPDYKELGRKIMEKRNPHYRPDNQ